MATVTRPMRDTVLQASIMVTMAMVLEMVLAMVLEMELEMESGATTLSKGCDG